jgi:cyclic pyranopterin phosphate synthase
VSAKPSTVRIARARGRVEMTAAVRKAVLDGALHKGEALAVARLAGIQAAKETSRLIPLCHPLALGSVRVDLRPSGADAIEIEAECRCTGPTGVEMEALTAVSVAALALYDMCKSMQQDLRITGIELVHKSGGRSGAFDRDLGGAS